MLLYRVIQTHLTQNEIHIKNTFDNNVILNMRILMDKIVFYQ